jgi:hypothetical protein
VGTGVLNVNKRHLREVFGARSPKTEGTYSMIVRGEGVHLLVRYGGRVGLGSQQGFFHARVGTWDQATGDHELSLIDIHIEQGIRPELSRRLVQVEPEACTLET